MTSTMKSNNETNAAAAVDERIEELKAARVAWEEGTYKKSNEELYKLLDDCLAFYLDIRSKTNKCKALNALLKARDTSFNEGTSLQTRIVRAVFGAECGKRAYAYARVITVSAVEKRPEVAMYDFITQRGGVEEIRRTKSNELRLNLVFWGFEGWRRIWLVCCCKTSAQLKEIHHHGYE